MIIEITGTPGTGKSSVAKLTKEKLSAQLIDIKKIVNRKKIFKKSKGEKEVDIKKLQKKIREEITKSSDLKPLSPTIVIEGHLACELKIPADYIFVLRCIPNILEKRLKKRKYSQKKINENLLAEMLDYCTQRAETNKKTFTKIIEIETADRSINQVVTIILDVIAKRKKKVDKVNYSKYLTEYTRKFHGR
ncbi:MAG: AAA family ATPase [Candidatus Micrarchaeota archaeon]|nr:AAA family ATPase [Candidatus Micrarchaeota archaeon]